MPLKVKEGHCSKEDEIVFEFSGHGIWAKERCDFVQHDLKFGRFLLLGFVEKSSFDGWL